MLIRKMILTGIFIVPVALLSSPLHAEDVPLPTKSLKVNDKTDKYVFTWSKAGTKGENGGSVNPDNVTYVLEELNAAYETVRVIARTKDLTYTYPYPTRTGEQDLKRFGLRVSNGAGSSDYTYARTIIGKPYNVPFHESFAVGSARTMCWQEGDGSFSATSFDSSDGDYGCMECVSPSDGSSTSFNLGKILLSHTENPILSFQVKGLGDGETMNVKVARSDGAEGVLKKVSGPTDEWTEVRIDLSNLLNEEYIIPKFVFPSHSGSVFIDAISVTDPYTDDLGVRINCGEVPYAGSDIEVTVCNEGLNYAEGGIVEVSGEDGTALRFDVDGVLRPSEARTFRFSIADTELETVGVTAKVSWPYDLNPCNDIASIRLVMQNGKKDTEKTDVESMSMHSAGEGAIMSIDGKVMSGTAESLAPGIYIIEGRKIIIK